MEFLVISSMLVEFNGEDEAPSQKALPSRPRAHKATKVDLNHEA
jgi:hypothetical protein